MNLFPLKRIYLQKNLSIRKKENAKKFKLKIYPHDWVFNFIEGDGKTFTFGINYFECEFYKFYKTQGAEDFMPIICISDYVKARPYRYGLKLTQTIRNGAPMCDFRYLKNGNISRGWSIDNLLEYKNK